jgi:hypothetical protein
MNRFDRTLQGILESVSATGSRRVGHGRFETVEPAEGQPLQRSRLVAGYVLAVALPAVDRSGDDPVAWLAHERSGRDPRAFGRCRRCDRHHRSGPGGTSPDGGHLDGDDLSAAISLVIVGIIVGVLSSRLAGLAARNTARRKELRQLIRFIRAADAATVGIPDPVDEPQPGHRTSVEKRLTAATMATVFAGAIARLGRQGARPED